MPELPEVETIRQDLREVILNKEITTVDVRRDSMVRGDVTDFVNHLVGNKITEIDRVGKLLIFRLASGDKILLGHLKMTGQLIYKSAEALIAGGHTEPPVDVELPNRYSYIIFDFVDGTRLFFNDMRTFGYMALESEEAVLKITSGYGIEPGTSAFTLPAWRAIFINRKAPVKAILLNQARISGIGNIYADEICFAARIRPDRRTSELSDAEVENLYWSTQEIIILAVKERGTTFNHYRDPNGRKGNFLAFLKVYGNGGKPCSVCETELVKSKVAGRGTVHCPNCQT